MKMLLGIAAVAFMCAAPAWADTILYAADNAPAVHGEVYRLDLDGKLADLSRSPFPDLQPRLSPDGRWVAFLRQTGDSAAVWIVHPNATGLRRISSVLPLQAAGAETAWSPDSRRLAVVGPALYLVGPGVRQRTVAHLDGMVDPHWSPDGTLLTIRDSFGVDAFTVAGRRAWEVDGAGNPAGWSPQGLFASSLGGRETLYDERGRALATFPGGEGAWSPDGTHLAVHHRNRLDIRTAGGSLVRSTAVPGLEPRSSNGIRWDGRDAVFVGGLVNDRVVRVDVRTGRLTRASTAVFATGVPTVRVGDHFAFRVGARTVGRLAGCTDDGGPLPAEAYAQLTRDRRAIIYQSYCVEPFANLWTLGGRVTDVKAQEVMPAWSPDGTRIAFTRAEAVGLSCKGCPATVWVSDADGANAKPITRADPDSSWDYLPSWSPDGKSIVYAHSTINTAGELFVVPATGGTPRDLHIAGIEANWGPQRIAYVDNSGLWTVATDGSGKTLVAAGQDFFGVAWSAGGALACLHETNTLLVATAQGIQRVHLPFQRVRDLAWSPDGTRVAVVALAKGAAAFDLYSLRPDGTDVKRLTKNVDAFNVSWR